MNSSQGSFDKPIGCPKRLRSLRPACIKLFFFPRKKIPENVSWFKIKLDKEEERKIDLLINNADSQFLLLVAPRVVPLLARHLDSSFLPLIE